MKDFEEKVFDSFENDLKLYYCGKRIRSISHHYGPYDQDRYLIYYIKEGEALLQMQDREITMSAKGFFVNFPNSSTVYRCAEGAAWSIKWIMVDGQILEKYLGFLGITRENPFVVIEDGRAIEAVFDEMYELFDHSDIASKIYCVSLVHRLFALLSDELLKKEKHSPYVIRAWELIESSYMEPEFNVTELAARLGLHHNYFSILFKRETGESPVRAISRCRMKSACKMLKFTDKPVREVARECGFSDELYFSRAFRAKFGVSPSAYRLKEENGLK